MPFVIIPQEEAEKHGLTGKRTNQVVMDLSDYINDLNSLNLHTWALLSVPVDSTERAEKRRYNAAAKELAVFLKWRTEDKKTYLQIVPPNEKQKRRGRPPKVKLEEVSKLQLVESEDELWPEEKELLKKVKSG